MSDRRSNEELVRRIGAAIADAAYVANEEGRQVLYSQLHRADEDTLELARRLEAAEEALAKRPEGREGIVTVYDHDDNYLGCMGIETWLAALRAAEGDTP